MGEGTPAVVTHYVKIKDFADDADCLLFSLRLCARLLGLFWEKGEKNTAVSPKISLQNEPLLSEIVENPTNCQKTPKLGVDAASLA